jgi:DNA-binding transcriptional MerR regulator
MVMTKQEAADFLDVTIRSIEAYAAKGKLTPARAKGKRGDITVYDEAELQKLKTARGEVVFSSLPKANNSPSTPPSQALQTRQSVALGQMILDALQGLQTPGKHTSERLTVADLSHKLMLSLPEAARLSGLPVEALREAVKAGKLKVVGSAGRGFGKVKREALEAFVKRM